MSAVLSQLQDGFDLLTVLHSADKKRLAKRWEADGSISDHSKGYLFTFTEHPVLGIHDLSKLLTSLESDPSSCVIRGRFAGVAKAEEEYAKLVSRIPSGKHLRRGVVFNDQALHYLLADIDGYMPEGLDPILQPVECIEQFISLKLPACFQGASYHWALSGSAGHAKNAGKLKAHVTFWLSKALTSEEINAWNESVGEPIDGSVLNTVQINYTAAPLFVEGVQNPIPVRSGFVEGWAGDEVDLVVGPVVLLRARGVRKSRAEMVDPRDKTNLVGLFCRTFEIEDVVARWLPEVFEFVTEDRLNFLQSSSGTAEGARVTDNRQGIYNSHDSDPFQGRAANKWDLVRHYVFGHLDVGRDEFETHSMPDRPSHIAMREMVRELPEMVEAGAGESQVAAVSFMERISAEITAAMTGRTVELDIAPQVAAEQSLGDSERSEVAALMRARLRALGAPVEMARIRQWLRVRPAVGETFPHLTEEGYPLCTLENLGVLLHQLGVNVRYNVISKQTEVMVPDASYTRDNKDNVSVSYILSECERARMPTKFTQQFLLSVGDANLYNPVMVWVGSKPWDGVTRLPDFFATAVTDKAEISDTLKHMLMRKWMLQAVAAASSEDGIAGQGVLTFTGAQNQGKTTWFKNLAPRELDLTLSGHTLDVKSKDSQLTALKHWIVELGEIDATFRKSDISALKSWVNQSVDNIRRPYAATESCYGRRTVFGASVNDEQFLADKTGNRRFWVIPVTGFQFDHGVDMQQVWAEVWAIVQAGGESARWNLNPPELELLNAHNEGFTVSDPIEERFSDRWDWQKVESWTWVTASQALGFIGVNDPKKPDTISAAVALKRLNGGQRRKSNGKKLFAIPADLDDFLK